MEFLIAFGVFLMMLGFWGWIFALKACSILCGVIVLLKVFAYYRSQDL
jgi:hypothetical protein